jgi:hypothetical protein
VSALSCPGCGEPRGNPNRVACEDCWFRLPSSLRRRIVASWRQWRPVSSESRAQLHADIVAWFKANGAPVERAS